MIRATTGRYVFVLNEDTTSERLGLRADGRPPRREPAGRRARRRGSSIPTAVRRHSAWRFPSPATAALGLLTLGRVGILQSGGSETRDVDWAMAAALLVRREALDEVGLFDEEFFIYSEETDLARRLRHAGWRTQYFPQVTVVHHESQFSAGIPERRINEMWRGRHRYWQKHHSAVGARVAALGTGAQYAAARGCSRRATATSPAGCACMRATRPGQRAGPARARGGLEPRARRSLNLPAA